MVEKSGRITNSCIKSMSRTLMTFTHLYPGFDLENAPRINVIFNNFSKKIKIEENIKYEENDYFLSDLS